MSSGAERRRSPRVELMGRVHGKLVPADVSITVREISLGGMSILTGHAFDEGSVLSFVLTLGDGAGVLVAGRVVYSRPADSDNARAFITGLEFVDDEPSESGVTGIVEKVR